MSDSLLFALTSLSLDASKNGGRENASDAKQEEHQATMDFSTNGEMIKWVMRVSLTVATPPGQGRAIGFAYCLQPTA